MGNVLDMERILTLDEQPLKEELQRVLEKDYDNIINEKGFLYCEGSVPVLLIAHLDTVHKNLATPVCWSKDKRFIMSPHGIGGDDRCGVYMVLQIIKELKCHVLFCEQEEVGCVGAKAFCKSEVKPEVNYIIEFDRKGHDDSVFYDCNNKEFETFVNSVGFKTAWGSCSDISHIAPYLKTAAVNLSSGYYNPHSLNEFIDMHFVERNIGMAKELIATDSATKYEYVEKKYNYYGTGYNTGTKAKGTEKKSEEKEEKEKRRGSIIITRSLMWLDPELYWMYENEWGDCPTTAKYYIDAKLNTYIEYNGIFEKLDELQVFGKDTLFPPEFIAKKAKLYDINVDDYVPFK